MEKKQKGNLNSPKRMSKNYNNHVTFALICSPFGKMAAGSDCNPCGVTNDADMSIEMRIIQFVRNENGNFVHNERQMILHHKITHIIIMNARIHCNFMQLVHQHRQRNSRSDSP